MDIRELARKADLKLLLGPAASGAVARLYSSNTMSDLIANAAPDTLLLTVLNNAQLIRVAELMDVPAICLVEGAQPCAELMEGAKRARMAILVSPWDLEATRLRLESCLCRPPAGAGGP